MLPRVVYDTNVIVSAILKPESIPAFLVALVFQHHVRLCLSEELLTEYREVLIRPKFGLSSHARETFLKNFTRDSFFVSPLERITTSFVHKDDAHVLECAIAAKAQYLVTGNTKHFPPRKFHQTLIVTPTEFALYFREK